MTFSAWIAIESPEKNLKKIINNLTGLDLRLVQWGSGKRMKADHEIIEEVKQGNVSLFSDLVFRHQRALIRLAVRMTRDLEMAEDIVQDSFVKAYRKLDSFEGRSSFKSWVYQITINTAKNKLRAKKRDFIDIDKVNLSVEAEADKLMAHDDIKDIIQIEIKKLPKKQRLALQLRVYEDLSFKEIAEIMECPYDTAKANYRHALMKLRHQFQDSNELKIWKDFESPINFGLTKQKFAEVE